VEELSAIIRLLTWVDYLALGIFGICWVGYKQFLESGERGRKGLVGVSHEYRLQWALESATRDIPVTCASLVSNLMHSVSFYASTTIYIIAGLFALVGTVDKIAVFTEELPFAHADGSVLIQLKLLLLIVIFVTAYFKFTWSLRQFNFLCILIGGVPHERYMPDLDAWKRSAARMAKINSFAGNEFNRGIRAYYYGLAALAWFINPWLFIASTLWVTWIMYCRDFRSSAIKVLRDEFPPEIREPTYPFIKRENVATNQKVISE
jgi:uncharacterized membrane protein